MLNKLNSVLIVFIAIFIVNLNAQETSEDPSDVTEGDVSIKRIQTADESCKNFIRTHKGLARSIGGRPQEGLNTKRNGDKFFISIATDTVEADPSSSSFPDALFDASVVANMKAKGELVAYLNQEMTSEVSRSIIQKSSSGEKEPDISSTTENEDKTKDYADMNMYDKAKLFINQQLDKAIDLETREKLNDKNKSDEEKQELIDDILNQKNFKDKITASSQGTVRGMKTIATYVNAKPNDKRVNMCMVNLWSEKVQETADAIATGNMKILKDKKSKKPLFEQIPDLYDEEGARKAFSQFGTYSTKNDRGEVSLISWGVAGCQGNCSGMSEEAALTEATIKADRGILLFQKESIEQSQAYDKLSQTSQSASTNEINYYSEKNIESRLSSSASGDLRGVTTLDSALWSHPINKQPTYIVVRAWTPSGQEFAGEIQESLDKDPEKSSQEDNPYESNEYDDGGSMGLDDDDF